MVRIHGLRLLVPVPLMPKKKEDPADRKLFILTEEQWDAFWEMLDAAIVQDKPRLRELFEKKPIWEAE